MVLFGCSDRKGDPYNEANYILLKKDSFDGIVNKRTFIYKYDSLRIMYIDYWDNGEILLKGFIYNGQPDGKFEAYDINGKLMRADSFDKGKKIYSRKFFIPDTSVKIFKNGKLERFTDLDSLK